VRPCRPQPEYRGRPAGKLVRDAWLKSNGRTVNSAEEAHH
jgi:hypothetical protein